MRTQSAVWLRWTPRVLGILLCHFISLFALDAEGALATAMHLIPVAVLLAILAVAWRWPAVGGAAFLGVAGAYLLAAWQHPSWIAVISAPLSVVGVLFLLSWQRPGGGSARA
jgi:hypothetical protein